MRSGEPLGNAKSGTVVEAAARHLQAIAEGFDNAASQIRRTDPKALKRAAKLATASLRKLRALTRRLAARDLYECLHPDRSPELHKANQSLSRAVSHLGDDCDRRGDVDVANAMRDLRQGGDTPRRRRDLEKALARADALDELHERLVIGANESLCFLEYLGKPWPVPGAPVPSERVGAIRARRQKRIGIRSNPLDAPLPTSYPARDEYPARREIKPVRRTGTRLVAERFLAGEEVFECEQCGGGMSERARRGGRNRLVCGYCGHERALSATPRAPVARQELDAVNGQLADLLRPAQGITSWRCTECGADVASSAKQIVGRCSYCGSNDFVRLEESGGVLQPQGLQRFACDPARAEQLLRQWAKKRPDAPRAFWREFKVAAVEARYVPYWILDVEFLDADGTPGMAFRNIHSCASRQLLRRMPAELRALEPFETRMVPPFEPDQLAGTVCERFSVSLDEAWNHARTRLAIQRKRASDISANPAAALAHGLLRAVNLNREGRQPCDRPEYADAALQSWDGLGKPAINFKYLLLPVYFFVLEWQGREYHALMDGAGDGVGMDYPRSAIRIGARRLTKAAAVLLVLAALTTPVVYALPRWREQQAREAQDAADYIAEQEERARKLAEERAKAERYRLLEEQCEARRHEWSQLSDELRTWRSTTWQLSKPLNWHKGFKAEGEASFSAQVVLVFPPSRPKASVTLDELRHPDNYQRANEAVQAETSDNIQADWSGVRLNYYQVSWYLGRGLAREGLADFWWEEDMLQRRVGLENVSTHFTGKIEVNGSYASTPPAKSVVVVLEMDPVEKLPLFLDNLRYSNFLSRLQALTSDWFVSSQELNQDVLVPRVQKLLDEYLTSPQMSLQHWKGAVKVKSLRQG